MNSATKIPSWSSKTLTPVKTLCRSSRWKKIPEPWMTFAFPFFDKISNAASSLKNTLKHSISFSLEISDCKLPESTLRTGIFLSLKYSRKVPSLPPTSSIKSLSDNFFLFKISFATFTKCSTDNCTSDGYHVTPTWD